MKILERKPRLQPLVIDRERIKYQLELRCEIPFISEIDFMPHPENEYYQLPEPYATQAESQFNLRDINLAERKRQLKAAANKTFTKSVKAVF